MILMEIREQMREQLKNVAARANYHASPFSSGQCQTPFTVRCAVFLNAGKLRCPVGHESHTEHDPMLEVAIPRQHSSGEGDG